MNKVDKHENYVNCRKDYLYYKYVRNLISICAVNAKSILDVGSGGVDTISHLSNVTEKYSLDCMYSLCESGVVDVLADFFEWEPGRKFDVVCCFQVIEYIVDAEIFCKKLLEMAEHVVIVSVPYMWEKGACSEHVQDPISEEKLAGWFGYEPTFCNIVDKRLIAVFLKNNDVRTKLLEKNRTEFTSFYKSDLRAIVGSKLRFPFERLTAGMSKLILYGAGYYGKKYYEQISVSRDYDIVLWVDKNYKILQEEGYEIVSPKEISKKEFDAVVITVKNPEVAQQIIEEVVEQGIARDKIFWIE